MAPPAEAEVAERPLSLAELDALVDDAAERSHAKNTKKTYVKSLRLYTAWCASHGLTPIPATTRDLGRWAADQASRGLAPATIKTRTSAIRSIHTQPWLAGLPEPDQAWPVPALTAVDKVVHDHSAKLAKRGWKPRKAEAMLRADLLKIKAHMAPNGYFKKGIDLRDWAILMLGFAMGGRVSELSCLDIDHIALDPDDPNWMMVRVCLSKTDQSGAGEVVMIRRGRDATLCPVTAVFNLISWLRMRGITSGPLFRQMQGMGTSLTVHGMAETADALEGRLSGDAITKRFSKRSTDAQIPKDPDTADGLIGRMKAAQGKIKRFTGHSGRRGGATETSRAGATHMQLCAHFRWKAGSKMAFHYVEEADKRENNPMAAVL